MIARSVFFVVSVLAFDTALSGAPPLPEMVILERVPNGGIQPQVQVAGDGAVQLLYYTGEDHAGDANFVRRAPEEASFSEPIRVNSQTGSVIAVGSIRGAQLAVSGDGTVHVVWNGSQHAEPKGPNGQLPLLYSRLTATAWEFEPQRNLIGSAYGVDGGACIAAGREGNVYVAWHAGDGQEDSRRVWLVRSANSGESFEEERAIDPERLGACGCCGMAGTVSPNGEAMFLYRSAREDVHRDMYLLTSIGQEFKSEMLHQWQNNSCPMSSAAFVHGGGRSWAAWETSEQIYLAEVGDSKRAPQAPPKREVRRKHPRLALNPRGELLLVWTEGTSWKKGGTLAWQVYDNLGRPTRDQGTAPDVPVWSFAAPYVQQDGRFVIVY